MKYRPFSIIKSPRLILLPRELSTFHKAVPCIGMGLGMLLITVLPQLTLAQEEGQSLRQQAQAQQLRKNELSLKSGERTQTISSPPVTNIKTTIPSPRILEPVLVAPKPNEKWLSPEELHELRRQLYQRR